jgi:squalene-hopene/tetraprenyl-beta-curcumene cyclase
VLAALAMLEGFEGADVEAEAGRGAAWLVASQHAGGGWGGAPGIAPSVEETALAVEGLARALTTWPPSEGENCPAWRGAAAAAALRGAAWLGRAVADGTALEPAPIGFYFANLWYFEKLYPLVFTVAALEQVRSCPALGGANRPHSTA